MRGATLQTVVTSKAMDNTADQSASLVGADLSDSNTAVHFSFDDMRGVSFAHAHMSAVIANQSMGLLRTEFMSCNLDGANFEGAELGHNLFRFAKLRNANFKGADLSFADFAGRLPGRRGLHRGEAGQGDVQGREPGRHQGPGTGSGYDNQLAIELETRGDQASVDEACPRFTMPATVFLLSATSRPIRR